MTWLRKYRIIFCGLPPSSSYCPSIVVVIIMADLCIFVKWYLFSRLNNTHQRNMWLYIVNIFLFFFLIKTSWMTEKKIVYLWKRKNWTNFALLNELKKNYHQILNKHLLHLSTQKHALPKYAYLINWFLFLINEYPVNNVNTVFEFIFYQLLLSVR